MPELMGIDQRLERLALAAQQFESEGLPFPIRPIQEAVGLALSRGAAGEAESVLKRGEVLHDRVARDWTWVRELLRRADELRMIAVTIGVDVQLLDARVGNARRRLSQQPLSSGSLEKAAASASFALAVLNDTIPKFCIQEAQNLGEAIRRARNRGEDVAETVGLFAKLVRATQDEHLPLMAQRLVEVRRAVARIPRAPVLPPFSTNEEQEILNEARQLARRLQRIKSKARDAHSAARLMTQVRAALSEDRRFGTPEEEIEALWTEVGRIARERTSGAEEEEPTDMPEEEPPAGAGYLPLTEDQAEPTPRSRARGPRTR